MAGAATDVPGQSLARSGIVGLDDVLGGGFTPNRLYLVEGMPGSGKTTLALQFLMEGVRQGESVLHVALSETEEELRTSAASHGWDLKGLNLRQLVPNEESLLPDQQYTMFHPSEMELGETTKMILADVERVKPTRVVFDSLSEMRLLAGTALRYRRQILALKQFFAGRKTTVMMLDDLTADQHDLQVHSIAHGVIVLEQLNVEYGGARRRLRVVKYRGKESRSGYHDYVIARGGLKVFPRLVASEHLRTFPPTKLPSGLAELDLLLGGGIERGTSTLIAGAAGTGKSSLSIQFLAAAAERGQSGIMFAFDESIHTLLTRAEGLHIPLKKHVDSGKVQLRQVDPAELSPGELIDNIRRAVLDDHAEVVVIDSLNGYLNAMPDEKFLTIQLHELLTFLGQSGVATLMVSAHHGLIGGAMTSPVDASYLADAIILLRYFENQGEVHQAISVMKKRGSAHERTIREFALRDGRILVGAPLRQFRGVLTGVPVYEGQDKSLMERNRS
jgi:circadian clock protein KaiC